MLLKPWLPKKTYYKIDKALNTDNIKKDFRLITCSKCSDRVQAAPCVGNVHPTWDSLLCSGLLVALSEVVSHRRHLDWKDSKHERLLWVPVPQDSVKSASTYQGVPRRLGGEGGLQSMESGKVCKKIQESFRFDHWLK